MWHASDDEARQHAREFARVGEVDRQVVEPGIPPTDAAFGPGMQDHQWTPVHAECGGGGAGGGRVQADDLAPELERPWQVDDVEVDRAVRDAVRAGAARPG